MHYYDFDKTEARREYRKRNHIFIGVLVGGIPGILVFGWLWDILFDSSEAHGYVIFPFALLAVGVSIWRSAWPCPRCHNPFYKKWWYEDILTTECVHCGLRPGDLIEDFILKNQ